MSVINGTVVTGVKVYEELIVKHEIFLSHKFDALNKKYNGRPIGGVVYGTILTFIFFALCTVVGLFFANTGGLPAFFDKESQGIFSFVDIVSN
jgi:hypothetical protein